MDYNQVYKIMLDELIENRLEVVLVPSGIKEIADSGGKIRQVVSENISWYKEICSRYPIKKKRNLNRKNPRTIVKRQNIIKLLNRLIEDKPIKSKYEWVLRNVAEEIKKSYEKLSDIEIQCLDEYGTLESSWGASFNQFMPWNNQF